MLLLLCVSSQENNANVFVALDLAPPSAKRIRDLDVSGRKELLRPLDPDLDLQIRTGQSDFFVCFD